MDEKSEATSAGAIERSVRSVADLHAEHYRSASSLQRMIDGYTAVLGSPAVIGLLFCAVAIWVAGNLAAPRLGLRALDPFPFPVLDTLGTLFAVFTTLLILATQRREYQLEERRSQLTLQLAALSEQKIAKIIQLIEEQRRDSTSLAGRRDPEADEMSSPADPRDMLDKFVETKDAPGD